MVTAVFLGLTLVSHCKRVSYCKGGSSYCEWVSYCRGGSAYCERVSYCRDGSAYCERVSYYKGGSAYCERVSYCRGGLAYCERESYSENLIFMINTNNMATLNFKTGATILLHERYKILYGDTSTELKRLANKMKMR